MIQPGSYCTFVCTLLFALTPGIPAHAEEPAKGLSLGVFPYPPTSKLDQIFAPIAARFGEVTGQPVTLRSRPDFDRFREQVSQQTYDIIFIQPFDYIRAAAREAIRSELLSWDSDNPAQRSLLQQGAWKRMDPVTDADYEPVRMT